MAWFSKEKKLKSKGGAAEPQPAPAKKGEGIWNKCDGCAEVIYKADLEKNWNVCPNCGHHELLPVRRRFDLLLDPGQLPGARRRPHAAGPARLHRRQEVQGPAQVHAQDHRPARRLHLRRRLHRRPPGLDRLLRLRVHGRVDGLGGGREGDAGHRPRLRAAHPLHRLQLHRRRPHAGGHLLPHADGQDLGGAATASAPSGMPYISVMLQPDHGRRGRLLRLAGRRDHRRAQGPDRLRRPARHRADHPPEAAAQGSSAPSSCSSTG